MLVRVASVLACYAFLLGCAETYCQTGPMYGTQCYSSNEIDLQRQNSRGESAPLRETTSTVACSPRTGTDGSTIESAECITLRHTLQQR